MGERGKLVASIRRKKLEDRLAVSRKFARENLVSLTRVAPRQDRGQLVGRTDGGDVKRSQSKKKKNNRAGLQEKGAENPKARSPNGDENVVGRGKHYVPPKKQGSEKNRKGSIRDSAASAFRKEKVI